MSKLLIELIPKSCHFSNVRSTVNKKDWNKIRLMTYEKADNKCEICGSNGLKQGFKHRVECHEIWNYIVETRTQKLIGLISLCVICHQVKHFGRAIAIGKEKVCFHQLMKVNKWSLIETKKHVEESFIIYKERSKIEWKLDISLLSEPPFNLILPNTDDRIFKIKKYKKKRKKKKIIKRPIKRF